MKRTVYLLALTAATLIGGCGHAPTSTTVCLLDVSRSITPEGFRLEFEAVDGLAGRMRRGDQLIVVPITGNAINDTPGHVLRLTAPIRREPYDADLAAFRKAAQGDLKEMEDFYTAHPANRTDILGAIEVAQEELDQEPVSDHPIGGTTLYLATDFLEDDGTHRFTDQGAASQTAATELAHQLQQEYHLRLPSAARVRFVELPSSDKKRVSAQGERSIRAFWLAYLAPSNPRWIPIDRIRAADPL